MPPSSVKNSVMSAAATDLGLGDQLKQQVDDSVEEKKKKLLEQQAAQQRASLQGGAAQQLLNQNSTATIGIRG